RRDDRRLPVRPVADLRVATEQGRPRQLQGRAQAEGAHGRLLPQCLRLLDERRGRAHGLLPDGPLSVRSGLHVAPPLTRERRPPQAPGRPRGRRRDRACAALTKRVPPYLIEPCSHLLRARRSRQSSSPGARATSGASSSPSSSTPATACGCSTSCSSARERCPRTSASRSSAATCATGPCSSASCPDRT